MKPANPFTSPAACVLGLAMTLVAGGICDAQTNFAITTPFPFTQFKFRVDGPDGQIPDDGFNSPDFDLRAGNTYIFNVDTAANFHPVDITTDITPPYLDNAYDGASPQNVFHDVITLTIPATNFPSTLYYICNIHGFHGQLNILPPIPDAPPQNIIVSIVVAPNLVTLISTGTNTTYSLVPQFSSNLLSGLWLDVPSFTNNFANGTNTTTFGRLDPVCGSNVFLRISQRPPQ